EDVARVVRSAGWRVSVHIPGMPFDADVGGNAPSILLIDDAERLSEADLSFVQGLKDCSVLLAGSESLERRCAGCTTIKLRPLGPEEAGVFIKLWLAQAGEPQPALDEQAVLRLNGLSAGIPRLLAILLAAGMWRVE